MPFDPIQVEKFYPEASPLMYEAMLIWKLPSGKENLLSEVCEKGDYFLTEKIDGIFSQYVRTEHYNYMFSRTISKTNGLLVDKHENFPHIVEAMNILPANTIIIGELFVPGGTSKDCTKLTGCLPAEAAKRQADNPINYYVHDIIAFDGVDLKSVGAEERYNILQAVWRKYDLHQYSFLHLAVMITEDMEAEISRILARGGEGGVLKKKTAPYTPGKRPAWDTVKVKQMDSIDLVCMGLCDATKEYTGKEIDTWSYWVTERRDCNTDVWIEEERSGTGQLSVIRSPNYRTIPVTRYYYLGWKSAIEIGAYDDEGNLVKLGTVSSGLTDEMREDMTNNPENYIGKVVSLDCMSIDRIEHTLRHPALKCWRDDKDAKDCKISEVF